MFSDVPAEEYDAFMGRFSRHLPDQMIALAAVTAGDHVLDVGCGPGVLTAALAGLVGPGSVAAVDPMPLFVVAARGRVPRADVRRASAEALPFDDDTFDVAIAQLVVHFMEDPVAGLAEMARVTRPGGRVAACVWDQAMGGGPLSTFAWALNEVAPAFPRSAAGATSGDLEKLFAKAGIADTLGAEVSATETFATFDEWFAPYRLGVGSLAQRVAALTEQQWNDLENLCRQRFPEEPFEVTGRAWAAVGTAPAPH